MALIKCSECGHEISDKAKSCPNCGCPLYDGKAQNHVVEFQTIRTESKGTEKQYGVAVPAIVGIAAYLVVSILLSNLLNDGVSTAIRIENDICFCGLTAAIITSIIAKSNLDRIIYVSCIIVISLIAYKNWEVLLYGAAIIVFITEISLILIAAIKRNRPSKLGNTTTDIIDWCLASPIAILLILGEFMGFLNIFRLNEGVGVLLFETFVGILCGFLNFAYMKWGCKKKIKSHELQSQILDYYKYFLVAIAVIGVFVGLF